MYEAVQVRARARVCVCAFYQECYKLALGNPNVLQKNTLSMNIITCGCVLQVTITTVCSAVVTTN